MDTKKWHKYDHLLDEVEKYSNSYLKKKRSPKPKWQREKNSNTKKKGKRSKSFYTKNALKNL